MAHFEEAIEDEDEFWEIGRKSLAKDIILTFATDFLTEAPAFEHLFLNWSLPNCEAPVLRSLYSTFGRCLKLCAFVALACGVVPDVEAPEGSGCCCWAGCGCDCFGLALKVEGVGDECGVLIAGKALELELVGDAGGSGGAGGATGGDDVVDGPRGWSFGMEVQLYWNSRTVSSSPVKNL